MGVPAAAEGRTYVNCPAGATTDLQIVNGAKGDDIDYLWVEAGAGTVALKDGAVTVFTWDGTAAERFIPLNLKSAQIGGWSVTTVGLAALASGEFS